MENVGNQPNIFPEYWKKIETIPSVKKIKEIKIKHSRK